MNLVNYERMDPLLLLGLVNTALRNDADDLDDLVKTHAIDHTRLEERLGAVGYLYAPEENQFRARSPGEKT